MYKLLQFHDNFNITVFSINTSYPCLYKLYMHTMAANCINFSSINGSDDTRRRRIRTRWKEKKTLKKKKENIAFILHNRFYFLQYIGIIDTHFFFHWICVFFFFYVESIHINKLKIIIIIVMTTMMVVMMMKKKSIYRR